MCTVMFREALLSIFRTQKQFKYQLREHDKIFGIVLQWIIIAQVK